MKIELEDQVNITTVGGKGKDAQTKETKICVRLSKVESGIDFMHISHSSGIYNHLTLFSLKEWDAVKAKVDRMIAHIEEM